MIHLLDKNTAEASEGWRVHFAGHSPMTWRIQYREGERHIDVKVEGGGSGSKVFFFVYLSDVQNWSSSDGELPISPADRKRVGKNIRAGLEVLNTPCRIE